jgi:hypothetical protein
MASYHNIDRSATKPGCHVGYAAGRVWHIRKGAIEGYVAQPFKPNSPEIDVTGKRLTAAKLGGISKLLEQETKDYNKNG